MKLSDEDLKVMIETEGRYALQVQWGALLDTHVRTLAREVLAARRMRDSPGLWMDPVGLPVVQDYDRIREGGE